MSAGAAQDPDKSALRSTLLARRDAMTPAVRTAASAALADRALPVILELNPNRVAGYWPIRSECDPLPLLRALASRDVGLALPVVVDGTVSFRQWTFDDPVVAAGFGTRGPGPEAAECVPDLILLPLAGFDRKGGRIGYGKGHYDRAVAALALAGHDPVLVGIGFAIQEVGAVPTEPHDVRLDFVITETELLRIGPKAI